MHFYLTGSVVGRLNFDNPEQVSSVEVIDSNPYFDFDPSNNTFTVKKRIDIDQGLNTLQLMILECTPTAGPKLEVWCAPSHFVDTRFRKHYFVVFYPA